MERPVERARLAERLVVCYGGAPTHFFSVLHPRTHEPIQLGRTDTQLLELRCFSQPKEKPASWLLMAGEPKEGAASGGLAAGEPKVAPALLALAEATPSDAHEQMASARVEGDEHEATAQRADPPVPKDGTGQEAGSADDSTVQHVKEDAEDALAAKPPSTSTSGAAPTFSAPTSTRAARAPAPAPLFSERSQQDGRLYFGTPIDPLFLLLNPLECGRGTTSGESKGFYKPLSDALESPDASELEMYVASLPKMTTRLRAICDVNDSYDEPMVRFSEEKAMSWLRKKTEALKAHLAADPDAAEMAGATNSRRSASEAASANAQFEDDERFGDQVEGGCVGGCVSAAPAAERESLLNALALVCEYLSASRTLLLCESFGVSSDEVQLASKGKKSDKPAVAAAATRVAAGGWKEVAMAEAGSARIAPPPVTVEVKKQKVAAKAPPPPLKKGQKTMGAFFTKRG